MASDGLCWPLLSADGLPHQVLPSYIGENTAPSSASGQGLRSAVAGTKATFQIVPRDPRGHVINSIEQLPALKVPRSLRSDGALMTL